MQRSLRGAFFRSARVAEVGWNKHKLGACAGEAALRYGWSNVCMHYFSRGFLEAAATRLAAQGRYHLAHKSIPSKDGPVKVPAEDLPPSPDPGPPAHARQHACMHVDSAGRRRRRCHASCGGLPKK
jgi:hypothetical protein